MTASSHLPAWHEGLAPVDVDLPVDRDLHRIRWEDGRLVLLAHPDPDAEIALAALGGGRCACLDVFDAWTAQLDDPEVLTVGRRHLSEQIQADRTTLGRLEREATRWQAQWAAAMDDLRVAGDVNGSTRLAAVAERAERRLRTRLGFIRVLALDVELQDRLQLTVLAGAEARWSDPMFRERHRARLHAALIARAWSPLEEAGFATLAGGRAAIELLDPGAPAVITPERIALPLSWLTNVWGRGVALDEGRFVVEVSSVDDVPEIDGGGKVLSVRGVDSDWRIRRA
ncbi:MAG TPA: hypothetical protein VM345_00265 [Acidimicrobiales bacterium]|jgi:hypothetical protein|nr:hypothetical protein [Acidimicrobiales bacterium]